MITLILRIALAIAFAAVASYCQTAAFEELNVIPTDLVLLNADPITDISATADQSGVTLKGEWHNQSELYSWPDEIAPRSRPVNA
jgi:hypothetical protein